MKLSRLSFLLVGAWLLAASAFGAEQSVGVTVGITSKQLTSPTAAAFAGSNGLATAAQQLSLSNALVTLSRSQDATLSNALVAFSYTIGAAATNYTLSTSNYLLTLARAGDTTTSNSLVTLAYGLGAASTNFTLGASNALHALWLSGSNNLAGLITAGGSATNAQPPSENLTNWSNTATGTVATVTQLNSASNALVTLSRSQDTTTSNALVSLAYTIGSNGTNYTLASSNLLHTLLLSASNALAGMSGGGSSAAALTNGVNRFTGGSNIFDNAAYFLSQIIGGTLSVTNIDVSGLSSNSPAVFLLGSTDGTYVSKVAVPSGTSGSFTNFLAVNVKDFGAVGNGVTDDSAAISNAVAYVSTNSSATTKHVVLPTGDYRITRTIWLSNNVTVTSMAGRYASRVFLATNANTHAFAGFSVTNAAVEDIGIFGFSEGQSLSNLDAYTSTNQSSLVFFQLGEGNKVRNCYLHNAQFAGAYMRGVPNFRVEYNTALSNKWGSYVTYSHNGVTSRGGRIAFNTADYDHCDPIRCGDAFVTIEGNAVQRPHKRPGHDIGYAGIYLAGEPDVVGNNILFNHVRWCNGNGIDLGPENITVRTNFLGGNLVMGNTVESNGSAGLTAGISGTRIIGNTFRDNGTPYFQPTTAVSTNAIALEGSKHYVAGNVITDSRPSGSKTQRGIGSNQLSVAVFDCVIGANVIKGNVSDAVELSTANEFTPYRSELGSGGSGTNSSVTLSASPGVNGVRSYHLNAYGYDYLIDQGIDPTAGIVRAFLPGGTNIAQPYFVQMGYGASAGKNSFLGFGGITNGYRHNIVVDQSEAGSAPGRLDIVVPNAGGAWNANAVTNASFLPGGGVAFPSTGSGIPTLNGASAMTTISGITTNFTQGGITWTFNNGVLTAVSY